MPSKRKKNKKQLFSFFRWLHIYCSTALFTLLIFFSITGITLNHRWYDSKSNTERYLEKEIESSLISDFGIKHDEDKWTPNLNAISEWVAIEYQLENASSIDIDRDMQEVVLEFRAPSSFASVIVNIPDELSIIEIESGSALGILNDLHKGRHSGTVWRWLIDISAVLMIVFSISGLIILYHGKKHRRAGTLATIIGTLTPLILYFIATPQI